MESTFKDSTRILSACCVAIAGGFLLYNLHAFQQQQKLLRNKAKCTKLENLPTEIISEIVSYLSVEDFLRCKSVWRQLNVDTKDDQFVQKFRMRKTPRYFVNFCYSRFDLDTKSRFTRTLATCDGLKLKRRYNKWYPTTTTYSWKQEYYIKNAATKKVLMLPAPPCKSSNDYGFSFVTSTSEYKVVLVYLEDMKEKCALLTLGADEHKWRSLDIPGSNNASAFVVQASAVMHCVRVLKDACEVSSLDLETECFSVTNFNRRLIGTRKEDTKLWAISWNGVLSLVYIEEAELKVLVLEDYKNQKWGDMFVVPLSFMTKKEYVDKAVIPLSAEDGLIWFKIGYNIRVGFDIASHKVAQKIATKSPRGPYVDGRVLSIVPSHIILKGMQPQQDKSVYKLLGHPLSAGISTLSYYVLQPWRRIVELLTNRV